ncbi:hypothetical protein HXS04_000202 [Campylobacter coli]|nr:hypothetical protein [Campylobacter coli]
MGNPLDKDNNATQSAQQQVDWEKRFKDTQAAFTRVSQEAAKLKAENAVLNEKLGEVQVSFSDEELKQLEELKFTDPDKYYNMRVALEKQKRASFKDDLQTKVDSMSVFEARKIELEEFCKANPHIKLNDEVIAMDIPPRITKKLENKEISFGQFLVECKDYLEANKVIGDGNTTIDQPNLGKIGGDDTLNVKADDLKFENTII